MQDEINNFLDRSADALVHLSDVAVERGAQIYNGATDLADALVTRYSVPLSHGIDWGVSAAVRARSLLGWDVTMPDGAESTPEPSLAPEAMPSSAPAAQLHVGAQDDACRCTCPNPRRKRAMAAPSRRPC